MLNRTDYTHLVETYIDTVFRTALNYTGHPSNAEDITQNVFLALLREKKPFASEEHIKYWLIRVTINECKKLFRSPWNRTVPLEEYAQSLSFPTPEHSELFYALMELPKKYRIPIYLYYYEEYSTEEIGKLLKLPKGTVCTYLHRGRQALKLSLQEAMKNE